MGEGRPGDPGGVSPAFAPGSRIAGYRLQEQIRAGGMAVVFLAFDERLGRPVALKILAPWLAADAAFRHRFLRESRAAATVDDPHIIPVYEADGVLFIAMRYVSGGSVRDLLHREGPLPAPPKPSGSRRARRSRPPTRPCSSGSWPRSGPPGSAPHGTPSWRPAARSPWSRRSRS